MVAEETKIEVKWEDYEPSDYGNFPSNAFKLYEIDYKEFINGDDDTKTQLLEKAK